MAPAVCWRHVFVKNSGAKKVYIVLLKLIQIEQNVNLGLALKCCEKKPGVKPKANECEPETTMCANTTSIFGTKNFIWYQFKKLTILKTSSLLFINCLWTKLISVWQCAKK